MLRSCWEPVNICWGAANICWGPVNIMSTSVNMNFPQWILMIRACWRMLWLRWGPVTICWRARQHDVNLRQHEFVVRNMNGSGMLTNLRSCWGPVNISCVFAIFIRRLYRVFGNDFFLFINEFGKFWKKQLFSRIVLQNNCWKIKYVPFEKTIVLAISSPNNSWHQQFFSSINIAGLPAGQAAGGPELGTQEHWNIKKTTGFISIWADLVSNCGSQYVRISRKHKVL